MLTKFTRKVTYVTTTLAIFCLSASAQNTIRAFTQAYSDNIKGSTTLLGNTSMHIVGTSSPYAVDLTKMNQTGDANNGAGGLGNSSYGNDNSNMQLIDIDGVSSTKNSSSANLVLPAGSNTIKFARLYWGGRVSNSVVTASPDTLRKVKIRYGTGSYTSAVAVSSNVDQYAISTTEKVYQSYVDVTAFVNANLAGTYTIADIALTAGSSNSGGYFGGWSMVVVYENPTQPYNSVRVYDGYAQVFNSGSATTLSVTLNGLNVPGNTLTADEAVMGTMSWEGDANLGASSSNVNGDFVKVNNIAVTNASNPSGNFWNGSITKNGSFVSTKNPNYYNQMGIDIDEVNVGTGFNIAPNATSVNIQFGTEADQYFPSMFTFSIRVKDPQILIDKSVIDSSGNGKVDFSYERLDYTLSGSNPGTGSAYNTYIVDTLPTNVTYVPGSLQVVNATGVTAGLKTDALDADQAYVGTANGKTFVKFFIGNGSTGTQGGELPAAGTYTLKFSVRTLQIPTSVVNVVRIFATSFTGQTFTDDATAVINPGEGPVAVKMTSFKASLLNSKNALLTWDTESELENDRFEIERSEDGIQFINRGKVTGNGSTAFSHSYNFTDEINTSAAVLYYRLKIVDKDGKYSYTRIIALRIKGLISIDNFNVYPNPFISDIKISLNSLSDVNATFRIISFDGKELVRRSNELKKGDNIIVMSDFGSLPKGSYILEVSTPAEKFIKKILKN